MPEDHLMGEHQPRNGGVESSRNCRRHPAGDGNGALMTEVQSQLPGQITEHRTQVHQRTILADRRPATQRNQGRQARNQATSESRRSTAGLCRQNRIRRRQATLLPHQKMNQQANNQPTCRWNKKRRSRHQGRPVFGQHAGVGGDQQPFIQIMHGINKADRRQRSSTANHNGQQSHGADLIRNLRNTFTVHKTSKGAIGMMLKCSVQFLDAIARRFAR